MLRRLSIVFGALAVFLLAGLTTRNAFAQSACSTGVTITGTLNVNSAHDITGRVGRTRPPSVCGSTATVPGIVDTLPHMYDVYRFVNTDSVSDCFTITLTWTPGAATMWANAYSVYTPGQSVTMNWIGDVGGNTNGNVSPQSMGITIAAGGTIDVVVMSIGQWTSTTAESDPYTLTVSTNGASTIGCIGLTNVLASLTNPTNSGEVATFTATVGWPAALAMPTGNVSFFDGLTPIGSSPLDGSGVATVSVALVAPGDFPITASYAGDSVFANSVSEIVTQSVVAVDAGVVDSGVVDSGVVDSGVVDSGAVDSGVVDSGAVDSGVVDSGVVDSGVVDSGVIDSGVVDSGRGEDSAVADSGVVDSGRVEDSAVVDSAVADSGMVEDSAVVVDSAVADTGSAQPDSGKRDSGTDAAIADGAAGDDAGGSTGDGSNSGCSCHVGPGAAPGSAMAALCFGLLGLVIRRRRKKK